MSMRCLRVLAAIVAWGLCGNLHADAPTTTRHEETVRPARIGHLLDDDGYGTVMDTDGQWLAVASPYDDVGRFRVEGTVAMYERIAGAWTFRQRLIAPDLDGGKQFGAAIDVRGGRLIVGAPGRSLPDGTDRPGAAYLYEWSGTQWTLAAQLVPANPALHAEFGRSVALFGDRAYIGARSVNCADACPSSFMSRRQIAGWTPPVTWSTGFDDAGMNAAMVIAGDGTMVIASPSSQTVIVMNALVHPPQFVQQLQKQQPGGFGFGTAVEISGHWIGVGVPSSRIEMFERVGTAWQARGQVNDIASGPGRTVDYFGISFAIDGDDLVATAIENGTFNSFYRGVRTFRRQGTTWLPQGRFVELDFSDAMLGRRFAVGAGRIVYQRRTDRYAPEYTFVPELVTYPMVQLPWTNGVPILVPPGISGREFGAKIARAGDALLVGLPALQVVSGVQVFRRSNGRLAYDTTLPIRVETMTGAASGAVVHANCETTVVRRVGDSWSVEPMPATTPAPICTGFVAAMSDDTIALSSRIPDGPDTARGVVDLFDFDGTAPPTFRQRLEVPGGAAGSGFAESVSIDGDVLAVGAPFADTVHVYRRDGGVWSFGESIGPSVAPHFGRDLSLRDDRLVVGNAFGLYVHHRVMGAWQATSYLPITSGVRRIAQTDDSVYVSRAFGELLAFREEKGVTLPAPAPTLPPAEAPTGRFGADVAVVDDLVYVGSPEQPGLPPDGNAQDGAVFVFREILFADGLE